MIKNKEKSNQNASNWRRRSEPLLPVVPEDESHHELHSLPRLSVVPPSSESSSMEKIPKRVKRLTLSHGECVRSAVTLYTTVPRREPWHQFSCFKSSVRICESMTVVLSAFYAKLLIVLGIALPVTSTIQNDLFTNIASDVYTIYLYIVSMTFLAYTFYHLRLAKRNKSDNVKRTRYGSFYLHIGVAGFGVGSIIYSCLQIGGYFDLSGDCRLIIVVLKPTLHIIYLVTQTIFIFSYNDVLDPMRGVVLDRFGLMHLIATNVCEWFNVVIQEARDDIIAVAYNQPALLRYANISGASKVFLYDQIDNQSFVENNNESINANETLDEYSWNCTVTNMITPLIRSVNPYLRPCGVEYSLLCSIIIAVIWNDICTVPGSKPTANVTTNIEDLRQCCSRVKSNTHFSVDCGSAHKGLFMGIAVLSGTIVSLMLFTGLFQNKEHEELALLQINIWETILFLIMTLASGACIQRMRMLSLQRVVATMPLEHALLLVTQCGVYLYYLFQIIGACFIVRYPEETRETRIISPLCAVAQSSCQTLLILDAWTRHSADFKYRPGRQLVTFLLVGNFALWLLNRVKNSRAEYHPIQMEFYGVWAWTLITHISVPLLVCYRFQATVCFYEIWKNSYKTKRNIKNIEIDDFELKNVPKSQ